VVFRKSNWLDFFLDIDISKKYNIKGYPTFILANKDGEPLYRWWGYTKEMLFDEMDLGFSDLTTIAEKEKLNQYNKNEGLSYELDLKNISLADAIKFKLHGANRYNKSYKNLTTDDYLKVSRNKNHNYNVHALKRDKNREINALVI